jgi:hypothetical protein
MSTRSSRFVWAVRELGMLLDGPGVSIKRWQMKRAKTNAGILHSVQDDDLGHFRSG